MEHLLGKKLTAIRPLTKEKAEDFWPGAIWGYEDNVVLVFEDGTELVASRDAEGNGPGCLFGKDKDGHFTLMIRRKTLSDLITEKRSDLEVTP